MGYSYGETLSFFKKDGTAMDVSSDTFQMVVKSSAGAIIATLTIGSGLEYGTETNQLGIIFSGAITATAGKKTYILTRSYPGVNYPVIEGTITVE